MTKEKAAELISENLKTVYAWALSRVSDKYDAEDLAGDIVEAALSSAERLRDDNAFYGWFWQIARKPYLLYCRSRRDTIDRFVFYLPRLLFFHRLGKKVHRRATVGTHGADSYGGGHKKRFFISVYQLTETSPRKARSLFL